MINKTQAKKNKLKIIDNTNLLGNEQQNLIKELKQLLPSVINSDNQLDTKALNDIINIAHTTSNNQGYELTFAGKGLAKAEASRGTEKELCVEKQQSKNFKSTKNIVIRGDNLEVLKILKSNYFNKIKMIYIDPPYNTKSEDFIYKDDFRKSDEQLIENFGLGDETVDFLQNVYGTRSHSGWLSFMYPRLKLARDLLSDDGVIFISIDNHEQANLKVLCDEIFGENNFVQVFTWVKRDKTSGVPPTRMILPNFEYVLCYKKNQDIKFLGQPKSLKSYKRDEEGRYWRLMPIQATGQQDNYFSIINPKTKKSYYGNWAFSQETVSKMIEEKRIVFPKNGEKPNQIVYASEDDVSPVFAHLGKIDSEDATKELKKIFDGEKIFDFPKPPDLIKFFIQQLTQKNSLILDSFAGSGTTGDAVMQLNAKDGGNRKFILVQIDEPIDKKKSTEAHKFCVDNNFKPFISSITIERLNRAGKKIKADLTKKTDLFTDKKSLDIEYKVYSLTNKPKINQGKNQVFKVENKRQNTLDTLSNMLVATGKTLDSKITEIIKGTFYQADDELYLLANIDDKQLQKYTDVKINLDGWADINLTQYLNLDIGQKDNICIVY